MTVASLFSCEKDLSSAIDENPSILEVCGTKDPINDLKWLSDEMKLYNYSGNSDKLNGVVLFEYKGDKVIEIQCSTCSSTNIHQHLCDGKKIDFTNPANFQDYLTNRKKVKVLYGTEIWK